MNLDNRIKEAFKEIEEHNYSWAQDIYERNKNNLNKIAIFYRGNQITYREMFYNAFLYARSLQTMGVQPNEEIPACLANTPELIYFLMAVSILGAKANIFGQGFDQDYILDIINGCSDKVIFVNDHLYEDIQNVVEKSNVNKIVLFSLRDSLKHGIDFYEEFDKPFLSFDNRVNEYKMNNNNILNLNEFKALGKDYEFPDFHNTNLDDEFSITYSSGSTHSTHPKAIVQCIRSYVTMARFHDPDVSGLPKMKNVVGLAHIPPHSNTDLITSISDVLSQKCTVACEPIYDKDFFVNSLLINKPNFVPATRSFWVDAMKKIEFDDKYKNIKMPFLMIPAAVGEPVSANEEKYINQGLRKLKAGTEKLPFPLAPVTLSIGGGDCEHGGLFFTLYKQLQEKRLSYSLKKKPHGLIPFALSSIAVLDENGHYCEPNTVGRLVANSNCTMKKYKDNESATDNFFIKDAYGKIWGDCNVYGYLDHKNHVHMKGRIGNEIYLEDGTVYPLFMIADEILKDTKGIMSCEMVVVKDENEEDNLIAHIEFQPKIVSNHKQILASAQARCLKKFPEEICDKLFYRIRGRNEGFPLSGCGKRSNPELIQEGIADSCIKLVMVDEDNIEMISRSDYINKKTKQLSLKK